MAFEDLIKRQKQETQERGYSLADIVKTRQRVNEERRNWRHHFDSYIEQILYDDPNYPASWIVNKAAELADARQKLLDDRFPEGLEIE